MTTIDELLEIARRNTKHADRQHDATSATIAQAATLTAQAMILYAASHNSVGESRVIDVGVFQQ